MSYGVQTWDASGRPNNYGIKPVSVVGMISLAQGQVSGTYAFNVPAGYKVGFVQSLANQASGVGRQIIPSGNTITIGPASSAGINNYPANEVTLIVFLEKA